MTLRGKDKGPRLVAFGNVAVGFIAIGNVAVGVVAIGFAVAIGPIAIGMNSVGLLLGLGLNTLGTVALGLINGLGVFTAAGVNALGARADSYVNHGESPILALVVLCAQVGGALFLRPLAEESKVEEPKDTPLADLAAGVVERGRVRARVVATYDDMVELEENGTRARVVVTHGTRLALQESLRDAGSGPIFAYVRASMEHAKAQPNANYRRAPQTERVLVSEGFAPIPPPTPFHARPGALRRVMRVSAWMGAAVSAATFVMQVVAR